MMRSEFFRLQHRGREDFSIGACAERIPEEIDQYTVAAERK
jgi:hypothetical protein